ncbi:hypothetical protein HJG60_009669 [Phyllostomus discolor]|uniref:Uncharacterized protein n=1 Tax=Phyllostomus discolor TaxID=89673 RepID=A0A834B6H1_9CHIR|nr:hypothetical protein HJG60_009669 [Phyllostomus discolor]
MKTPRPRRRREYRPEADQGRPAALLPPRRAPPARVGLTLPCSTAPGCRPVLETDSRPRGEGPWGLTKIPPVAGGQGGRAPALPAALAFLASQEEEESNLCTCPLWGLGPGAWPSATCLFGGWVGGT